MVKNAELWKKILDNGAESDPDDEGGKIMTKSELLNRIAIAPIIVAPSVYNFDEERDPLLEISPQSNIYVSLPFSQFWMEWKVVCENKRGSIGAFIHSERVDDLGEFLSHCHYFQCVEGRKTAAIAGEAVFFSDASGRYIYPADGVFGAKSGWLKRQCSKEESDATIITDLRAVLTVLSLLACKNVGLRSVDVPERSKFASKRHGGIPSPAYRYHVLVVKPPGARSDHPGEEIGSMPYHTCRGHHAEYGPEFKHADGTPKGLLFGKFAGRFYIPQTMKGDKKNGVVEKDYEVRAAI